MYSHVVNLMTTMPGRCHQELMTPLTRDVAKEAEFEGYNMEIMAELVAFLNTRLDQNPVSVRRVHQPRYIDCKVNTSKHNTFCHVHSSFLAGLTLVLMNNCKKCPPT